MRQGARAKRHLAARSHLEIVRGAGVVYRPAMLERWIANPHAARPFDSLAAYDAPGPQEQAACQARYAALA